MISLCLSALIGMMGTEGRNRSIWPYFEELLLQAGVNGKEGSGALLQSSVTVMACIQVWWKLLISESRYYALSLSILVAISVVL